MLYLWVKAFHIVSIVCWFAGLFTCRACSSTTPKAKTPSARNASASWKRKLYRGIMGPAMVATLVFGIWMLALNPGIFQSGAWIHAKLTLVVLLIGYHHMCGAQVKRFARGENTRSHVFYRWFNEVPVLILLAIVILVVVKPF